MGTEKSSHKSHHRARKGAKIGKPKLRVVGGEAKPKAPDFPPSERDYFTQMHKIIDAIFEEAADRFEWTWSQLASHSNLGYGTVCNLGERHTKYPRFQTVFKLAEAVGWKLITQQEKKRSKGGSQAKIKVAAG